MKNTIKSLLLLVSVALVTLPLLTSCSTDDDSNPTMKYPTSFVLNTPPYAENNIYDLSKSETVTITTSQPDYGYPAITIYEVQVSLSSSFEEGSYTTLETTYTSATINLDGVELNNAVVKLYQNANGGADPSGVVISIYIRLQAHVSGTENTYCLSNVICLSKVVVSYVATIPSTVYVGGSSIHSGTSGKAFAPVYGLDGQYYAMAYLASGATFFWGDDADNPSNGYSLTTTLTDDANAGLSEGSDGGIQVANGGWYVLYMTLEVSNNTLYSYLTVCPPEAYIIGATTNEEWNDSDPAWALTPGATASDEWVSPAFGGSGELRAYIKVPNIDWWRTEFTLYNGNLYWREVDIPDNWANDVGPDYSVSCSTGGHLYIDFDYDKGYVTDN